MEKQQSVNTAMVNEPIYSIANDHQNNEFKDASYINFTVPPGQDVSMELNPAYGTLS